MSEGAYEIKKKLLEIQNELLKGAAERQITPPQPTPAASPPGPQSTQAQSEDALSILKELRSNQQKIMHMLTEINSKL